MLCVGLSVDRCDVIFPAVQTLLVSIDHISAGCLPTFVLCGINYWIQLEDSPDWYWTRSMLTYVDSMEADWDITLQNLRPKPISLIGEPSTSKAMIGQV